MGLLDSFKKSKNASYQNSKLTYASNFITDKTKRAEILLDSLNESAEIANNTDDPTKFFTEFEIMIDDLKELIKLEGRVKGMTGSPKRDMEIIMQNRDKTVKEFIDRCYDAAVVKLRGCQSFDEELSAKADFYLIDLYRDKMDNAGIVYHDDKLNQLENYKSKQNKSEEPYTSTSPEPPKLPTNAVDVILNAGFASDSLLQLRLGTRQTKAYEIMEKLELAGIVRKPSVSEAWEILFCQDEIESAEIDITQFEINPDSVSKCDNMSGHEFEKFCADILKENGFIGIEVTSGSGDYGADILAAKDGVTYAIQCKCYSSNIGNKAVQEVYSGKDFCKRHVGVILTNQYFTASAKKTAERTGIVLWDRDWLDRMIGDREKNIILEPDDSGGKVIRKVAQKEKRRSGYIHLDLFFPNAIAKSFVNMTNTFIGCGIWSKTPFASQALAWYRHALAYTTYLSMTHRCECGYPYDIIKSHRGQHPQKIKGGTHNVRHGVFVNYIPRILVDLWTSPPVGYYKNPVFFNGGFAVTVYL